MTKLSAGAAGQTALLADISVANDLLIGALVHDNGIALDQAKLIFSFTQEMIALCRAVAFQTNASLPW